MARKQKAAHVNNDLAGAASNLAEAGHDGDPAVARLANSGADR